MIAELLSQLGVGFFVALSGALIPGPLLTYVTIKTLDSGPRTGTLAATGHIAVELGILALIAYGLGSVLKSEFFKLSIGSIGGIILIGLGVLTLSKSREPPSSSREVAGTDHHPFVGGVLFSTLLNPSVGVWWVTVGISTLMLAIEEAGRLGGVFWIIGHFTADVIWFSSISYSVYKGKEIIGGRFYKGLLATCGATLLVLGLYFSYSYLPELFL